MARARLLTRLGQRWHHRLTTIVAGPGFGKTVLLAEALAAHQGAGQDLWLSCEPDDRSSHHLIAGLARAAGLSASDDLDAVLESLWARTPESVCLVLDDVHEVPRRSTGAAVLQGLLDDLPGNAHVVLASRDPVPVRTARLAASGGLHRITEADLVLDAHEMEAFARLREVDPGLLAPTGGWPALAELTATAGGGMVLDYLWEEVLADLGDTRTVELAKLVAVGGADDDIASAIRGRPTRADDLVAGVPLVERSADGVVSLHALWGPALRRHLADADAGEARRAAAAVHIAHHRHGAAVALLAEAEAWDDLLAIVRDGAMHLVAPTSAVDLCRWCDALPAELRNEPEVLLAAALERRADEPLESVAMLVAAREAFAVRGDVDGEAVALAHEGLIRWWTHDVVGLAGLIDRVTILAETGSTLARTLTQVGDGAVAHLAGDSDAVRAHLDGLDGLVPSGWVAAIQWLRSVAHRRDGDLDPARLALERAPGSAADGFRFEFETARLRTDWLAGVVDETCDRWRWHRQAHADQHDHYTEREATLELARIEAWLGRPQIARLRLEESDGLLAMPSPLADLLACLAEAAIAVAEGDEPRAAARLSGEVCAALGGPDAWYWRDRAAIALSHVLVPESRDQWTEEPLGTAHLPGLRLATALESVRSGESHAMRTFEWPAAGVVRAHLPQRWVAELIAGAAAAGSPAPSDLPQALGADLRPLLRRLADEHPVRAVAAAAATLAAAIPALPSTTLDISVLGPLVVRHDGVPIDSAELRRRRVRELLCCLVFHREVRRDALAVDLWPDHPDPAQNLRVTLAYLQRVLQPDRGADDPPFFVRTHHGSLRLEPSEELTVDVWSFDTRMDAAVAADRAGSPAEALDAYLGAIGSWRGEPHGDAPDADWVVGERTRLRARMVSGGLRAGELLLAVGRYGEALAAAEQVLVADRWCDEAYQLMVRVHLAEGDPGAADRTRAVRQAILTGLGVHPS